MADSNGLAARAGAEFTSGRRLLLAILASGYLLMVPTLGIYRFWLVTRKRRFYWHNTVIDGDPLEYTGTALQLLIGFLFALGFFLPLYLLFFYLSTQAPQVIFLGYGLVGVALWFLSGYAIYRARDFRLSRTLWRGIRFDQRGSGWVYALRRFLWSIAMILTLGLIYPFMAADLWRYRYANSWYGDRQFSFSGSWRQLAGPFYLTYALVVALAAAGSYFLVADAPISLPDGDQLPAGTALGVWGLAALVGGLGYYRFRGRELSAMFSSVRLGSAGLTVRVRGRSLMALNLVYAFWLVVVFTVVGGVAAVAAVVITDMAAPGAENFDPALMLAGSWMPVAGLVGAYLVVIATFSLLGELILGFGFWRLVVRGATIENIDSLRTVRAAPEDRSLAGEGLADALNVGAY